MGLFEELGYTEKFDVPQLGLEFVDIFTVLKEVKERKKIEGPLLDFRMLEEENPGAAMEALSDPEIVEMFREAGMKNVPEFPLVEKYRVEKRMKASRG
ncbi:MAG: hypothetical protein HPY52_16815 [Firmicutes bacterium]|nr:hypothetical protein [Bacillota bacterium]